MSTVFVTGPTGVLGRATIPLLVARGYAVKALSRSAANDSAIRALGAEPVRANLFDVDSLTAAISGADAVLHLATKIPPSSKIRDRTAWAENDRIRAGGTRYLVDAAMRTGVTAFVYPSFACVYGDHGDAWIEATTTPAAPIDVLRSTIAAEQEVARFAAPQGNEERRGVALRLGGLYGPAVPSTRDQLQLARRGFTFLSGSDRAFAPMLWIDDAASALIAALEHAPSGTYDVVDDEPLRHAELNHLLASAAARRRLAAPPLWLLRLLSGEPGALFSRGLRVSNRRFREATGWAPSVHNAREGLGRIRDELAAAASPRIPTLVMLGLWVMALVILAAGLQQQFAPRSFYDNFPGFGLHWVSVDGPYNEHLMRDLGGANLALAVLILFAIARPTVGLIRAVAVAVLVAQAPHFMYHAMHLGILATDLDRILQTVSLAIVLLIPIGVLLGTRTLRPAASGRATPANASPLTERTHPLIRPTR